MLKMCGLQQTHSRERKKEYEKLVENIYNGKWMDLMEEKNRVE